MLRLVVAELRATLSGAAWWALLMPAVLLSLLAMLALAAIAHGGAEPAGLLAFGLGWFAVKFALLLGVISGARKVGQRSVAVGRRAEPGLVWLMVAKVVVAAAVGVGYAVVVTLVAMLGARCLASPPDRGVSSMLVVGGVARADVRDLVRVGGRA